jgi:hypothetical protein
MKWDTVKRKRKRKKDCKVVPASSCMNPLRLENLNRQIIKHELEPIKCVCITKQ